jgi:hypothetical protein
MTSPNSNLDAAKTVLQGMGDEVAQLQSALGAPVTDIARVVIHPTVHHSPSLASRGCGAVPPLVAFTR